MLHSCYSSRFQIIFKNMRRYCIPRILLFPVEFAFVTEVFHSSMVWHSILCMHFILLNAECRMDPIFVCKNNMNETNSDIISYVRLNATWKLELLKVSRNPNLMAVVRLKLKRRPKWWREESLSFSCKDSEKCSMMIRNNSVTQWKCKTVKNQVKQKNVTHDKENPSQLNALNENDREKKMSKWQTVALFAWWIVFHIPSLDVVF